MSAVPASSPANELQGSLSPQEKAQQGPEPHHYADVSIRVGIAYTTIEVEVFGKVVPGFRGSRETPAERGGFVLDHVEFEGMDITAIFDNNTLDEIKGLGE